MKVKLRCCYGSNDYVFNVPIKYIVGTETLARLTDKTPAKIKLLVNSELVWAIKDGTPLQYLDDYG